MSDGSPNTSKPKHKRRKFWGIFGLLALLILGAVNGPISRGVVRHLLETSLQSKGLEGSTTLSGSLLQGYTLHDLSFQGNQGIQHISFSKATVSYNLWNLLAKGQIRRIALDQATVVIDLHKFPPSKQEKKQPLSETLESVRQWLSQPEIQLAAVDITLLKLNQPFAHFQWDTFHHSSNSCDFAINGFQARDGADRSTPAQDVVLSWSPSAMQLPQLEVLPDISLQNASVDWRDSLAAQLELKLLGAELHIGLTDRLAAKLTHGVLDTHVLQQRFAIDLPFSATVDSFETNIRNWQAPPQDWDVDVLIGLPSLSYRADNLSQTQLHFRQSQQRYTLSLDTHHAESPITMALEGNWTTPHLSEWWSNTNAHYQITHKNLSAILAKLPQAPETLDSTRSSFTAEGDITFRDLQLHTLTSSLSLAGLQVQQSKIPVLNATLNYEYLKSAKVDLNVARADATPITLHAHYHFGNNSYTALLNIQEQQPAWINQLLNAFKVDLSITQPIDLQWAGSGSSDLSVDQQGQLDITSLALGEYQISANASYQWPERAEISHLLIQDTKYSVTGQLDLAEDKLTVHNGTLHEMGTEIATFRAQIPYQLDIKTLDQFFAQSAPWSLSLHSSPLSIPQLKKWFQLDHLTQLDDLQGSAALSLELAGSPLAPHLNGLAKLENLRGLAHKDLDVLHMLCTFATADEQFILSGELLEDQTQRANLNLVLPFTPQQWLKSNDSLAAQIDAITLDGSLEINQLPLNRVARFIEELKTIDGSLTGSAELSGTVGDPQLKLDSKIVIPKIIISGNQVDDIRDIEINCSATSDRQLKADLKASINGGNFTSTATADFSQLDAPHFDIQLKTDHAMIFRNDSLSIRANADIKLVGTLEDALITGDIGLVESLFYKDIDILPIGVPSSAVADVELPSLNSTNLVPNIPAPFDQWKLGLTLRFEDPMLIRGNLAGGQIEGSLKAAGTLANPSLDGSIVANQVVARLPFSVLKINRGFAHFSPQNGLIPTLDIQGKSAIGNYDTTLYVYGPASSPKTSFTSSPPLPQSDIMTLLATGVTTAGLSNNKEVATLRALQLFLVKLRQESGETKGTKLLEKLLGGIQDFELNINETDHFTGRKFSSAKANINKRLYFTAQIDGQKQTRGLLVFVLKSR